MEGEEQSAYPVYWDRLSSEDQKLYISLQRNLASPNFKNLRNKSLETFKEVLNSIKSYVVRGDNGDHDRMLVCGICWLPNDVIAINTNQLRKILSKSKSSINNSFQQLGYGTVPTGADSSPGFIKLFPELNAYKELRQWTFRQIRSNTPAPSALRQLIQENIRAQEFMSAPPTINQPPSATQQNFGCPISAAPSFSTMSCEPQVLETTFQPLKQDVNQQLPIDSNNEIFISQDSNDNTEFAFENDDIANYGWDAF